MRCIFTRSDPDLLRARWFIAFSLGIANIGGAAIPPVATTARVLVVNADARMLVEQSLAALVA